MGGLKAVVVMVVVQMVYAFTTILYKLVITDGMSLSILVAYRFIFSSAFLLPLAFFLERKSKPKITGRILFQAFVCALFGGSLQQFFYVEAISLASATYTTAMCNLIPGVTFILAVCFRLERLNIGKWTGKTKVVGTLLGIGGAMILTFYKGTEIHIWSTHFSLTRHVAPHQLSSNQPLGCALAFGNCVSYSLWLIIQTRMSEKFGWHYTSAALMAVMASIQSVIFALFTQTHWNQWNLGFNIKLLTVLSAGIGSSGVVWVMITWCVRMKGPLYASTFVPLLLVLVTIAASLLLDETLHFGSIIGSLLIVVGLYTVLWGKGKELKEMNADLKKAQVSLEGEISLKHIITNNHPEEDHQDKTIINNSIEKDINDNMLMNPFGFATLLSFFTSKSIDDFSTQEVVKQVSNKVITKQDEEDRDSIYFDPSLDDDSSKV